jgi:L-fucose isomerase-like protein
MKREQTFGVIIGTRGFFPGELCEHGRTAILKALKDAGHKAVVLEAKATGFFGAIESLGEAHKCADLFKKRAGDIDGIIVTLPNFGDERAVANAIRFSGLDVPVLVHAFPDEAERMTSAHRRDSFCGKMSVCNNLRQYGIKHSLTTTHTSDPAGEEFKGDLAKFAAVCRVVRTMKGLRLGALGARPAAFKTVRFSEKLLEASGIGVETLDLSEAIGKANKMGDRDKAVQAKKAAIKAYTSCKGISEAGLVKMAKLGVAIDDWAKAEELTATAIQCWTSLEEFYGVVPCALMSMMSENLLPSACETDIAGLVGMVALQAASGSPSALLDWNNNYGEDPDKCVLFHCSNLPKCFFCSSRMDYQAIIAGTVGKENTYGTIVGRVAPGPFTFCRISTDDEAGLIAGYVGEGEFTDDALDTFGGYGVARVDGLPKLLAHICENGFEHHVAANRSQVADAVAEALGKYKGWEMYRHEE